jgi:hypothetical protein
MANKASQGAVINAVTVALGNLTFYLNTVGQQQLGNNDTGAFGRLCRKFSA